MHICHFEMHENSQLWEQGKDSEREYLAKSHHRKVAIPVSIKSQNSHRQEH